HVSHAHFWLCPAVRLYFLRGHLRFLLFVNLTTQFFKCACHDESPCRWHSCRKTRSCWRRSATQSVAVRTRSMAHQRCQPPSNALPVEGCERSGLCQADELGKNDIA